AEVHIIGRVQGVWFRQSTKNTANQYGVVGWCRNNPDSSVGAVFEGEESNVKSTISWCETGPELARVDNIQVKWEKASGEFSRFEIY
ncbi:MAG: acylphosphatase, partial [Desulfuromusa sp.]|nr:acylphosphatase [Desulfuromusa sp.]